MTKVPWDILVSDSGFSSMVQDRLSLLMYDAFSRQFDMDSGSYVPLRFRHKLALRRKRNTIHHLNVCAQVTVIIDYFYLSPSSSYLAHQEDT